MRSVLMMLGVVLHSAQVFNPNFTWLVSSPNSIALADHIVVSIHAFRMPAFFVISGFFCIFTLQKYGWQKFLRKRFIRIIVPLAVTALTLNTVQQLLLNEVAGVSFDWIRYLTSGGWIFHLWFLVNLLVYFSVAVAVAVFGGKLLTSSVGFLVRLLSRVHMFIVVALMPLFSIAMFALGKLGVPIYADFLGTIDAFSILRYAPYFAFGGLLAAEAELFERFSVTNPLWSVLIIVVAVLVSGWLDSISSFFSRALSMYLTVLISWFSVLICFAFFRSFCNQQSRVWLFLSDASYTVYLFHHSIVVAVGLFFVSRNVNAYAGLPLLIALTLVATLIIHVVFVKSNRYGRFLFNGKLE